MQMNLLPNRMEWTLSAFSSPYPVIILSIMNCFKTFLCRFVAFNAAFYITVICPRCTHQLIALKSLRAHSRSPAQRHEIPSNRIDRPGCP